MKLIFLLSFVFVCLVAHNYAQQGVIVDATSSWTNTNYMVSLGDSLTIVASGYATIWNFGTSNPLKRWLSPAGYGANFRGGPHYCATCPEGSLVGKIGESGTPFFVGPLFYLENSQETGNLYLSINDVATADNYGQFIAIIFKESQLTNIAVAGNSSIENYVLMQNYPNPFNPSTTIEYQVKKPQNVAINIFSINGELVKNLIDEQKASGNYSIKWDGTDNNGITVASGTYFYQIKLNEFLQAKKMILLK